MCISTFSVDVPINGMKIPVLAISAEGILPARHVRPLGTACKAERQAPIAFLCP